MSTKWQELMSSSAPEMSADEQAVYNSKHGADPAKENVYADFNMSLNGISHGTIINYLERNKILWTGNIFQDFDAMTNHLKGAR
jgi:hypothetical protein